MNFSQDLDPQLVTVSSYDDTSVVFGSDNYPFPVCLFSAHSPLEWPHKMSVVSSSDFLFLLDYKLEVMLWGTGLNVSIEHFKILSKLIDCGLFIEAMSTPSACRTFNILCLERRRVGAVLFP